MASPSKEENILKLILENSPLKEWRFLEIVKEAKVTKLVANKWLKKYISEGLIKYIKINGKYPYYIVGNNNPIYYSKKRIYALEQLHKSGLIPKLLTLNTAKTIILFGSIIKGDWYKNSDIDVFIYGKFTDFNKKIYELKLNKQIEVHNFENQKDIKKVKTGLIKNIVNGYILKGEIQDFVKVL
jgi:predicted nucleotidyltransferase